MVTAEQNTLTLALASHLRTLEVRSNIDLSFEVHLFDLPSPSPTSRQIIDTVAEGINPIAVEREIAYREMRSRLDNLLLICNTSD